MPRYKLVIAYDGTPYAGWQVQRGHPSVQGAIECAVERFSGEQRRIQCAGRTDAGVHAAGQVAHLDLARSWPTDTVRDALNAHLKPEPVAILSADLVPDTFNARTSALRRHYRYRILNRRPPPTLERAAVWHVPRPLDATAMQAAAIPLLGRHDFTTFRAADCQADSPIRTLERIDVERVGDDIIVETSARSFLHHQVRSIVGSLVQVGIGRWGLDEVGRALAACNRAACGPMAPASGLVFMSVEYPPHGLASGG